MIPIRVIAIATSVADSVRTTNKSPRYNHPAHTSIAAGYGPCRHCLKTFKIGAEQRTLFTYDAFEGADALPLPGPVFIHTENCQRYPEDGGYPEVLRQYPSILEAFAKERRRVAEVRIDNGSQPDAIQDLLRHPDVDYILVRDKNAGCFDFRVQPIEE